MDLSTAPQPMNLLRSVFHPAGLRPWIANWEVVAQTLVQRVFREAVAGVPDRRVLALLEELRAYPGSPTPRTITGELPFHRIEAFFPADDQTERFARDHLGAG